MLRGKTILITGGAGFIGSHLTRRLAEHNKVVILDNFHRNALQHAHGLASHPNVTVIEGDILDAARVRAVLAEHRPNIITHMASIAGVQTVISQPTKVLRINVIGTYTLLDAITALQLPIERFIDFSTSEVYGPSIFEADEEGMTTLGPLSQPRWYYAVSKLASEYLTHSYHTEHGMPIVSIRPFNVYGPLQVGEGAVQNFIANALAGKPLIVHNNGTQIRSWCYIDDFIEGVLAAMVNEDAIGKAFNIGNPGATVTNLHLANLVLRESGSDSVVEFRKIDYPEITLRVPNINRAETILGFAPKVGIEEGVKRTVAWMQTLNEAR